MKINGKASRALVALTAVIGSLMAVGVAPAMATPHWSGTTAKVSGSLSISASGQTTKTCTAPTTQESSVSGATAIVSSPSTGGLLWLNCAGGGRLEMFFDMKAASTTSVEVLQQNIGGLLTPWGGFYTGANSVTDLVNGSGSTSSTITFSNDSIGSISGGGAVTANGTLNVTTSSGGLLTVLP